MSIHKSVKKDGTVNWIVRYRQAGSNRQSTFATKRDAQIFEATRRMEKSAAASGQVTTGETLLADFGEQWWATATPRLQTSTRRIYSNCWNNHVLPYLGEMQLRELTPRVIEEWRTQLTHDGRRDQTVKKAMNVLQTCLQHALVWGEIQMNPVQVVKKPSGKRQLAVRPVTPREIEQIRQHLLQQGKHRDATLVSVLGYAGLRPGEALALRWDHVRSKTLLIESALAHGEIKSTKTGQIRSVRIVSALREDLEAWQAAAPPHHSGLVFASKTNPEGPWRHEAYKSWVAKSFKPAAAAAGRPDLRPYDLRHSYASLLIREGKSVVEVAAQLGHAPTMTLSTYAHVMADLDEDDRRSAEELILEARREISGERHLSVVGDEHEEGAQLQKGSLSMEGARENVRVLFAPKPASESKVLKPA